MKIPTIKDIAAEAGVNHCVVTHVLHNDDYAAKIRPETRQRILAIAQKLGYVKNQLAIATRTGQVNTIGVIVNFLQLQTFHPVNQIVAGIMQEATVRHYNLKFFSEDDFDQTCRQIMENRIDKLISMSVDQQQRERTAELAEKYAIDLVYAYEHGHREFPAVNTDNTEMTTSAVHYLAERGHSRIGLLCMPHKCFFVKDRHSGYLRGMTSCGLKIDPRWISCSGNTPESVKSMLALPVKDRPTAFIALFDISAAKAQRIAWQQGLRIPQDFSIIGIGDMESSIAAAVPITTFQENLPDNGKLLVRLVLGDKIEIVPDEFNVYHTLAELKARESVFTINNHGRKK